MPNRRRIGYMPSRRFDEKKNLERRRARRKRIERNSETATSDGGVNFEEWTRAELYSLATERGIRGRSRMTKEQLIRGLRQG